MDDLLHDSYAVQHIPTLIRYYPTNKIKYPVEFLHEFTDGCSAQYKSKHCTGFHVLLSLTEILVTSQKGIILRPPM